MIDRQLRKPAFLLYHYYRRTVLLKTRSHTISEPYLWSESDPSSQGAIF